MAREEQARSSRSSSAPTGGTPRIPLTTGKWEEGGVDEFPGKVTVCTYRDSDDKYTEQRGFPRPVQQWHVEVERLDAEYVRPDGERITVTYYQTIDLETMDKAGQLHAVRQGSNKATYVISGWEKAKIRLDPDPTKVEGRIFQFRRLRSKLFGTFEAKGLLIPLKPLPDDYEFDGEMQEFLVSERGDGEELEREARDEGGGRSGGGRGDGDGRAPARAASGSTAKETGETDWDAIAQIFHGNDRDADFSTFLTDGDVKHLFHDPKVKKAVASGDIIDMLIEKELIEVSRRGKIHYVGEEG